ncbi:MAG: YedE family putative selenium transporter [Alphaproteobacteria bacterium]
MNSIKNFLSSRLGIILAGSIIGIIAVLLQYYGNPANMGICMACFVRDITGATGFHRAAVVQYLRPEIPALILGAFLSSVVFGEFKSRSGSSPILRFVLGACAMIGALVFLGCPWRAFLRLAGGDLNALYGIAGLVVGVFVGTLFIRNGYSLGATQKASKASGLVMPLIALFLLALRFIYPPIEGADKSGLLFYSLKGPGASFAPLAYSVCAGILIGFICQRSRFCTMGAVRDLLMFRQVHLLSALLSFLVVAFVANNLLGLFHMGFDGQPVAHTASLWNFLGMVGSGLAFALAGGCPGRQLVLSAEGDSDAGVFVLGMFAGAAISHNMMFASSPAGVGAYGVAATVCVIAIGLVIGLTNIRKI